MALCQMWGFESGDYRSGWETGTVTNFARPGTGGNSLRFNNNQAKGLCGTFQTWNALDGSTCFMGAALYDDGPSTPDPAWLLASFGTDNSSVSRYFVTVQVNTDRSMTLFAADALFGTNQELASTGAGAFAHQTWHYLEMAFKPHDTTGIARLILDGVTVLDFTGDTRVDTSSTTAKEVQIWFNAGTGATGDLYLDDVYVCTSSANGDDIFTENVGEIVIAGLHPSSDVTHEWSSTEATGWEAVQVGDYSGAGYSSLEFISTTSSGGPVDRYGLNDPGLDGIPCAGRLTLKDAGYASASSYNFHFGLYGAAGFVGRNVIGSASTATVFRSWGAGPGEPWADVDPDALEGRVELVSSSGGIPIVRGICWEVAFLPPAAGGSAPVSAWDGDSFEPGTVSVWDGDSWEAPVVRAWDGDSFEPA